MCCSLSCSQGILPTLTPMVSVIIPTYNRATLLLEALQSIVAQTFVDFEVLIVDDGSTDETNEIVTGFPDERFIYICQENRGRSAARNRAISEAKGRYVAFLDSDDSFAAEKLERQVEIMEAHPEYGMIYTSAKVIDEQGREQFSIYATEKGLPYYRATESGFIYDRIAFYLPLTILLPTVMVRTSVLKSVGGFDEKLHRFEDTDLWRRIAKTNRIFALDLPLTTIRSHAGNRMEHPEQVFAAINYYISKIREEDGGESAKWHRGSARLYLHYAIAVHALEENRSFSGTFFNEAVRLDPADTLGYLLVNHVLSTRHALQLLAACFQYAPLILVRLVVLTVWRGIVSCCLRLRGRGV